MWYSKIFSFNGSLYHLLSLIIFFIFIHIKFAVTIRSLNQIFLWLSSTLDGLLFFFYTSKINQQLMYTKSILRAFSFIIWNCKLFYFLQGIYSRFGKKFIFQDIGGLVNGNVYKKLKNNNEFFFWRFMM